LYFIVRSLTQLAPARVGRCGGLTWSFQIRANEADDSMKILLAADGSTYTRNAALYLVKFVRFFAQPPEIHVVHVHPPTRPGSRIDPYGWWEKSPSSWRST
jgi:hypothetical protein